jgi:hypothetical protein
MGMEKGRRDRLRIVLELEDGSEPISGTIAADLGPAEPFAGVMQLIAAVDRVRGADQSDGPMPAAVRGE